MKLEQRPKKREKMEGWKKHNLFRVWSFCLLHQKHYTQGGEESTPHNHNKKEQTAVQLKNLKEITGWLENSYFISSYSHSALSL